MSWLYNPGDERQATTVIELGGIEEGPRDGDGYSVWDFVGGASL